MDHVPDDSLWGMTGDILRRLDAQERLKNEASPAQRPDPPRRGKGTGTSPGSFFVPREITSRHKLALLHHTRCKYAQAERLYQEVLASLGEVVGAKHLEMAGVFNNMARMYHELKRYAEAEPLLDRSLAIVEEAFGKDHPKVARRLANLADLYAATGRWSEADAFYQRALAIEEKSLGLDHAATKKTRRGYEANAADPGSACGFRIAGSATPGSRGSTQPEDPR